MNEIVTTSDTSKQKDNAYLHWCEFHGQRRYYVSCIHLIEAWRKGNINDEAHISSDCARAIKSGACNAVKMRKEEESKDSAIYYERRNRQNGTSLKVGGEKLDLSSLHNNKGYWRGWNSVSGSSSPRKSDNVSKPIANKHKETKPANDYAGLITDMIADEKTKSTEKVSVSVSKPQKNESMLEMAQRLIKNRGAQA